MKQLSSLLPKAQRCIMSLMLALCATSIVADTYYHKIDGINYKLDNYTHIATVLKSADAEGNVEIPSTVTHTDGHQVTYDVHAIEDDAFKGNTKITSLSFSWNPSVIASEFLSGCTGLKSVSFTSQISEFGEKAFFGCTSLETVTALCNGMTAIKKNTFYGCSALKSFNPTASEKIEIPAGVATIEEGAFQGCSSMERVELPASLTAINKDAFNGCSALETMSLPAGLQTIGTYAFAGCSSLKAVAIPSGVEAISGYAFYQCSTLATVSLPEGLQTIGSFAFSETGLTSLTLPASATTFGESAFMKCESLQKITLPSTTTSLKSMMFASCTSLTTIIDYADELRATSNAVNAETFRFVDLTKVNLYVKGSLVDAYKNSSYDWNQMNVSPLKFCKDGVYYNITSATTVEVTYENLVDITSGSGGTNYATQTITIPATVVLGGDTFSVTAIGEKAFSYSDVKTITIPKSVKTLGAAAFEDCSFLTQVSIPSGVTAIPDHAFSGCSALTEVTLPSTVAGIGEYAFSGCTSLATLTCWANTPPALAANTFLNANSLGNIWLVVTEGAVSSYKAADIWKDFHFEPEGRFKVEDLYYKVLTPTSVAVAMFPGTDKPAEDAYIVIPEYIDYGGKTYAVTAINESVFSTTGIKSVIIPGCVSSIGNYAFNVCSKLESVYCLGKTTTIGGSYAFGSCPNLTIYVSASSVSDYKTSWSDYASVIKAFPGVTPNSAHYATYSAAFDWKVATPGVKAYKASVSGTTITLTELTDGYIPSCSGVLLYGDVEKVEIDAKDDSDVIANMNGNKLSGTTTSDGQLMGIRNYGCTFVLGDGEQFLHYTGSAFILNRAYLWFQNDPTAGSSAPLRIVTDEGEAMGIDQVSMADDAADGKYMQGGRIVIVKGGVKYDTRGQIVR